MRLPIKKLFSIIVAWTLIVFLPLPNVDAAPKRNEPIIHSFTQKDLDGDGIPDEATILATNAFEELRVLVFDQGNDMKWSTEWHLGTDFANDIWLFKSVDTEQTKLIIRFEQESDIYWAQLYDDLDGDGSVKYELDDAYVVNVLEAQFPTVSMSATDPWLRPDGTVNQIVKLSVQRPLPVWFVLPEFYQYFPENGEISFTNEVVDSDNDGNPDYELGLAFPNLPDHINAFRSQININVSDDHRPNFENYFLWPYLGSVTLDAGGRLHLVRPPENLSPPIKVDWQEGQIRGISPFLPNYGLGNQWLFLTTNDIEKNAVNDLDWETFAYFDFTNDDTMDILLRATYPLLSKFEQETMTSYPEQVNIAWSHQNLSTMKWDYELKTARNSTLPSTIVKFHDFAVHAIPFENVLDYYGNQSDWAYATFVIAESNPSVSNEGNWEWGPIEEVITDLTLPLGERFVEGSYRKSLDYLAGNSSISPSTNFDTIREGFRGEYADLFGPARLYFSPVDRKLHLLKALHGIWNLPGNRDIRYENLGGEYLNHWILLEEGEPIEHLYVASGFIVHQRRDKISIYRLSDPEALFYTQPPSDATSWETLDTQLNQNKADFAPDNFDAMAQQFGSSILTLTSADLDSFRALEDGFRFELTLQPAFSVEGLDSSNLRELDIGEYVLLYDGSGLSVDPQTLPQLEVLPGPQAFLIEQGVELVPNMMEFELENAGNIDAEKIRVVVKMNSPNGDSAVLSESGLRVNAGTTTRVTIPWTPSSSGQWNMTVNAFEKGNDPPIFASHQNIIVISDRSMPSLHQGMTAFGLASILPILGVLIAIGVVTTVLVQVFIIPEE